ncbi:PEBP family protein [bacterium]|nr:PEBP family protein [bacterium]
MRFILAVTTAFAASAAHAEDITADIWVDNWFTVYANGEMVMEDPVSITTERSFNAESATFTVDLPAVIAIEAKDFKENDSGLEYIGQRNQQVGDGGMIAQFMDAASGDVIAVTDADTKCLVVQYAPVDLSCADEANPVAGEGACDFVETDIPDDWTSVDFDDSDWPAATVHTAADVGPKDGYDEITWDDTAELIWGENLKQDNTLLCRMTIGG